jgi:hypothetical protein
VGVGTHSQYVYFVHLQDQLFGLQTSLVDLFDCNSFPSEFMSPLEHLAIGALPEDLIRPCLKKFAYRSELGGSIQSLHPKVAFLDRFQKENSLVYLRQLYLNLPIPDTFHLFIGKLARVQHEREVAK